MIKKLQIIKINNKKVLNSKNTYIFLQNNLVFVIIAVHLK